MKSTGMVRAVDKMGRVVIPKEIRKQLKDNRWSWAPKKGKWTYHNPEEPRPGKHRFMTFEEIQDKHGAAAII